MDKHINQVRLLGYYGSDESHCLAAWQSTELDLDIELPAEINQRVHALFEATVAQKKKSPQELLKFLHDHEHFTPFIRSLLHFQVTADIASHIHCLKHKIAVDINSSSLRYKELHDQWYLPEDWEGIIITEPDGEEVSEILFDAIHSGIETWQGLLNRHTETSHALYHEAVKQLTPKLGRARAKESARYFLPYNKQLDYDVQFNFRSFMHFQHMRNSSHAQKEIREIAQSMLELVKAIPGEPFKCSLEAFGY